MKNKILSLALSLLCGFAFLPARADASAPGGKNIGLQMYSLRKEIGKKSENIDANIAAIGKAGYKYVESASYSDGKIYGMQPADFKEKVRAAGMFALSCHVNKRLAKNPAETDWGEVWKWWDQCIAAHKAAGMKYIVMPSMPKEPSLGELRAYCDYYNKIGERCKAAGLKFGYHNHAYEFEKKYPEEKNISMYEYMLQNTDPDKVFFEMDVYWTVMGRNSPVDLFRKYPGRFLVLHIKDNKELGESGMVGFDAIFKNIGAAGTKYLIVEVEKYDMAPVDSIRMSLDYLNKSSFVKEDYSGL
jgi:sugar phosphate isomerase/epimerase